MTFTKVTHTCRRCEAELSQNPEDVSDGYSFACLECDEDFCEFETIKSNVED
jgi:hypothetical protein